MEGVTEDGDYKLNVLGRRVAIYCYNMTGTPAEYVSLHVDNIGKVHDISCTNKSRPLEVGWTTFTKIRLDIRVSTLGVYLFGVRFPCPTPLPSPTTDFCGLFHEMSLRYGHRKLRFKNLQCVKERERCVCVCVCVCERERERCECVCVCVCVCV